MDLSIIIPVYNEVSNVKALYDELSSVMCTHLSNVKYEIIYVDDGSEDATADQVSGISEIDAHVRLISFTKRFGLSAALSAGFDQAQGTVIVSMDGDLQHDPKDIPKLLNELNKRYDLVCGNRRDRLNEIFNRYFFSVSANYIARLLFGMNIHDVSTTFRAYRRPVVKSLLMFDGAHRFIPVLARMQGFKVGEVVIAYRLRHGGLSKVQVIPRLFKVIKDAVLIRIQSLCMKFGGTIPFKKAKYEIEFIR